MYPWIARNLIYYPVQAVRGEKLLKYLREVRAFNKLSAAQMKEMQWCKLQALIEYVYKHNSYYKKLFDEHNIKPDMINSPDDYSKIPFLTKQAIKERSSEMLSTDNRRFDVRKTSGSTGVPLKFVKDRDSLAYMNAVMHDVYSWYGIEIGDRSCRIWAIPLEVKKQSSIFIRDFLQNRIRLNSFDVSDESSISFYHAVRKFKPKFMMGVPSYMTDFCKRLKKAGFDPADMGLEVIISTGEILYPAQKQLLLDSFKCKIANEYGTTESGIIAFACPKGNMHLMNHNLYIEIINPKTGTQVKPGESGELVLTELHSYKMPFIRYKLSDIVIPKEGICECGLESPVLEHIEGRLEDMIITPDGKKVAGGMLYYTLTKGIQQFKAFQRSVDRLEVFIEKSPTFDEKDFEKVKQQWREYLGENMKIDYKFVDKIPPDRSGKMRYFVPEYDPDYITKSDIS